MPIRNVKIAVMNAVHSKAVQEYLFINDCGWCDGRRVCYTEREYLYVDSRGTITHGNGAEYFATHSHRELFFEYETKTFAVPKARPTIQVFGKTYDKEEFDKALASLQTVTTGPL